MTLTSRDLHLPAGSSGSAPYEVDVDPLRAGWTYCGLRVLALAPGQRVELDRDPAEMVVVPLAGACLVAVEGDEYRLHGRDSVFTGVTDTLYVPGDRGVAVSSEGGGRFALATAARDQTIIRGSRDHNPRIVRAEDVPVELRGAGQASRQVHNFGTPGTLDAERLIVCEVLTPAGNWSSWPPHKHDEDRDGESVLEEIYYFEVAAGPAGAGIGYQRVYGHDKSDVDVLAEVRSGDVVLIPHGWHGPSMAAPGYDLYYLNVMAGPGERAWNICDDPAHAWVRAGWGAELVDPRLPFTSASRRNAAAEVSAP
ncbi:MAG: 5-deoxy-glucuronate isomerase [Nocardioidaceae bacterium]|nr:5-deoxy-glucuronate isomerase [Nocardioidaceae bacterium]